jgi:hypothetical protein
MINSLHEIIDEPVAVAVHLRRGERERLGVFSDCVGCVVFSLRNDQPLGDGIKHEIQELTETVRAAMASGDMPPSKVRHFWNPPAPTNHKNVELKIGGDLDRLGEWCRGRIIVPILGSDVLTAH